eukprot:TRINITY_DN11042_c0_g1_i2.p1 TRINITY_DN11042_c0_g1~~TRINITY_DN11042_c0_g1_i2.p1  ORF type:complete len:384 (+),score=143.88 TRINITY_DN11042_c0_g1_i2:392-1543(+)
MATQAAPQYAHATQPHALAPRKKYRDVNPNVPNSMMSDRRIVRGSTYAAAHVLANQPDPVEAQRKEAARRRRQRQAQQDRAAQDAQREIPRTPSPVEGRKHMDIQTENYLEEITDQVIEADVTTQTDAFMDRPPTPLYIPKKTGVDIDTQIYEGDLFDFDLEVEPILEVLVGKTLEQGMMEVMEEEELANMRAHQEEFIELRNAELAETQRLEAAEKRRYEEKERRLRQERERQRREKEEKEIIAAREFAKSYLSSLETAVFRNLSDTGFFHDPVRREVENEFMPWLEKHVSSGIDRLNVSRRLADAVVRQAFERKKEQRLRAVREAEEAERARIQAEKEAEEKRIAEEKRKAEEEAQRLAEEAARKAAKGSDDESEDEEESD